jgi:plastocyanin
VGHRYRRRFVALALPLTAAAVFAGCGGSAKTAASATASSAPAAGAAAITIQSLAFHPSSLTVTPGATVSVHNTDNATHTVSAVNGAFDTGDINPNQTVTFTAPLKPGTYPYMCHIHPFMTATLVVS